MYNVYDGIVGVQDLVALRTLSSEVTSIHIFQLRAFQLWNLGQII